MKSSTLPTLRVIFTPADDGYHCLVCLAVVEPKDYGNPSCPDCGGPVRYFTCSIGTIHVAFGRPTGPWLDEKMRRLDALELDRIRTDLHPDRRSDERGAAGAELSRRSSMDSVDLYEHEAWTLDVRESDLPVDADCWLHLPVSVALKRIAEEGLEAEILEKAVEL